MTERVLVCIPVDAAQANRIAAGQTLEGPVQGFTANPALYETFGLTASDDEQAEYAALLLAGLWGLIHHSNRLVLTAMIDPRTLGPGAEVGNGGVSLSELRSSSVEAWFSDDEDLDSGALQAAVAGLSLDDAWEAPQVQAMHSKHDLAWHSITELAKRL